MILPGMSVPTLSASRMGGLFIEDPDTFTRPWKIGMPLYRRIEKNAALVEFRCVEFVEDLIYGHNS